MTDTTAASSKLIHGRTGPWEIVKVVETHAQVATKAHSFAVATL